MRHFLIACALLASMLSFCLVSAGTVRAQAGRASEQLRLAERQARRGDFSAAGKTVALAESDWAGCSAFFGVVLPHAGTNEIRCGLASLRQAAALESPEEFLPACAGLIAEVEQLRDLELPTLRNIL